MEQIGWGQLIIIFILLLIPLLYQASHVFKYYFKLVVYYGLAVLIGVGVCLYSLRKPKSPDNHVFVTVSVKKLLMKVLGMDIIVRGEEHLNNNQAGIMAINHQSSIDMLPLFYLWPKNAVCLAKREILWFSGTFGLGAWLCGTIWIDRLNREKALKTMEITANLIKTNKHKVAIFPEGTRNHKGSMLPFKKGAFHLAVQGQVPIFPIVFSSYDNFYNLSEKRFDEGKVLVEIMPPISTVGLKAEDVTDLTEKTRQSMLEVFDRLNQEIKEM